MSSAEAKLVEAAREVKDDLEGLRLAAERMKGKAVVKSAPQETRATTDPSGADTNRQPIIQQSPASQVQQGETSQAARILDTQLARTQNLEPLKPLVRISQDSLRSKGAPNGIVPKKSEQETLQQSPPVDESLSEGKDLEQGTSHDSGYLTDPRNNGHVLENGLLTIDKELEQVVNIQNGEIGIAKRESSGVV
jgi:hypothetical protein